MSGQLRVLKNRIRSIGNTKKITRAMEMVAAAKLKRFQSMMAESAPYTYGLEKLLKRVVGAGGASSSPYLETRKEKRIAVFLFTSDTGLCGTYNEDLIKQAETFLANIETPVELIGVGKSGTQALARMGKTCSKTFIEIKTSQVEEKLEEIENTASELFLSQSVDAVYAVYSHFLTSTKYEVTTEKLLPFEVESGGSDSEEKYIMEPDAETLFERLIPAVFKAKMRTVFLEAFVSEQIARMHAMHQATENAGELIEELVLARNKARQASITKELIEIVSGSKAMKN